MIPGLNDSDIPRQLERARDAGARHAFLTMLRLPAEVLPVFSERLAAAFPERQRKIWGRILELRGGRPYVSDFGARMVGKGPHWRMIEDLFEVTCRRLGLNERPLDGLDAPGGTFRRPSRQATLFEL
jgi:DNA repair photolyase